MTDFKDDFNRRFKKLRISLTDICNLACKYCVDEEGAKENKIRPGTLSTSEYLQIIDKLHQLCQLKTVRLTGGEPLLYGDIINLVEGIKLLDIPEIKITTNATYLEEKALSLKKAGVNEVNISLDALDKQTFKEISRKSTLEKTLSGIDAALNAGIKIKLNSVIMKGVNENQIIPLMHFAREKGITIRFLELMRMGYLYKDFNTHYYPTRAILHQITKEFGQSILLEREKSSTADYWVTEDMLQEFGIISNESHPFCQDCDRLRLDAYGKIYGCLSSNIGIKVLHSLKDSKLLYDKLIEAMNHKQKIKFTGSELSMKSIGG